MSVPDQFERAQTFREGLGRYLGLAEGQDVDHVGITLGPADMPIVTMPLDHAERLLRDASLLLAAYESRP